MSSLRNELVRVLDDLDESFEMLETEYKRSIPEMFPALSHRSITVNGKQYFVKMNIELEEM